MAIDSTRIEDFINQDPFRKTLYDLLTASGFTVTWTISKNFKLWGFFLKPTKRVKDLLGVGNLEILVWVVQFDDFQAKTIEQAVEIATQENRLGKDFVLVITEDTETAKNVVQISPQISPINIIGFSISEIRSLSTNPENFLPTLQARLYVKDLYWVVDPIKIPRYFYGHNKLLSEIASSLANSTSNIGLFGLRKMGKTSFLYRLIEILKESYSVYIVYLDIQRIDGVLPTAEYLLWSLGESILDSIGRKRIDDLVLFGKYELFSAIDSKDFVREGFVVDFRKIIKATNKKFIIAFDEVELMAPPSIIYGSSWMPQDFLRVWRILRGMYQEHSGRIAYFVTGTNPKIVEQTSIESSDNPIFNFFQKKYLGPFDFGDSKNLLEDIGSLMGISWQSDALNMVHQRTGGHPLLMRAYGSAIHNARSNKGQGKRVLSGDVSKEAANFLKLVESQVSQMVDVLSQYYENEFILLETLAQGKIGEFKELAELFPNDISHLEGYGIIEFDDDVCKIKVEPLQTWIVKRKSTREIKPGVHQNNNTLASGIRIGTYKIEGLVGHSGGFSKVYKAIRIEGENPLEKSNYVAIKVLESGSVLRLQREVDILSKFNHPNIVKLITFGQTEGGKAYLVMEYLEGQSLRSRCQRSFRLTPDELKGISVKLLEALKYIHPDHDLVEKLRSKKDLLPQEFTQMEQARHGKVHRDIKPENIILTDVRGPVLIDFNISVAANQEVRTVSHTPGYLPPDFVVGPWTQDIDLYQLGLTLAQAATGMDISLSQAGEYDSEIIQNLSEQVRNDLPEKLAQGILKLFAENKMDRFQSAASALKFIRNT
ncbi:MAG: protein kinase [Nodosilinea sp. WJT8-NPBG4]|jgi:serine/threonine-protein kinase|nr:protein kinase [Nodosilinea sp. WJT8-NPBG4]